MRVRLVRGAWKLLVAVKDGLVLLAMLLFFGLLFAALAAKPNPAIKPGALLVALDGTVVEQPSEMDPLATLSGASVAREHRLRDVSIRVAISAAELAGGRDGQPAARWQARISIKGMVRLTHEAFSYTTQLQIGQLAA